MSKTDDARPKTIESSLKTLDVIEGLWELDGAGVTELAEHLDLTKSTVYFHLSTLKKKGYIVSDGDSYRLSLRFLDFGEYVKRTQPLHEIARPAVEELAESSGERVYCMVEQHGLVTMLCVGKGDHALQTDTRTGTHGYMHCTAAGKAILAHLPAERVHEILDRWGLREFTEHTITDRDELFRSLEDGRERGYFFAREEYEPGLISYAAPIRCDDHVSGAISVEGPKMRLQESWNEHGLMSDLLGTANMIEVNLSFSEG